MKILWVEDFGRPIAPSTLIENVFGGLLSGIDLDRDYSAIGPQLSDLFAEHTLHEIHVCQSYLEWKKIDEQHAGDFDVVLIDINLESYKTPKRDWPKGTRGSDFNQRAGFYIYHQLIKRGFPDDNIAFFTAEGKSLQEFSEYCGDILLDPPKHTFEKSPNSFPRLRQWLGEKAAQPSLILRRGVLDGCRFMKEKIEAIDRGELNAHLIFYKTIPAKSDDGPETLTRESLDYLFRLRRFFSDYYAYDAAHYELFVKELVAKWEESKGVFVRAKQAPRFTSWLDERFHRSLQVQMKTLRNWSSHRQLSTQLQPKEVAFFFMLAMRALVETDLNEVFRYEKVLSTLFKGVSELELKRQLNSGFEFRLEQSYEELRTLHADVLRHVTDAAREKMGPVKHERRIENYFLALFRETGEAARWLKSENEKFYLIRIRESSVGLFYQSFWHGLFPMDVPTTYYATLQKIKFNFNPLPASLVSFLARMIFEESFRNASAKVDAAN